MTARILTADEVRAMRKKASPSTHAYNGLAIVADDEIVELCESHEALRAEVERLRTLADRVRAAADSEDHARGCEVGEVGACTCLIADLEASLAEADR